VTIASISSVSGSRDLPLTATAISLCSPKLGPAISISWSIGSRAGVAESPTLTTSSRMSGRSPSVVVRLAWRCATAAPMTSPASRVA
jgi:hypothetical protein